MNASRSFLRGALCVSNAERERKRVHRREPFWVALPQPLLMGQRGGMPKLQQSLQLERGGFRNLALKREMPLDGHGF